MLEPEGYGFKEAYELVFRANGFLRNFDGIVLKIKDFAKGARDFWESEMPLTRACLFRHFLQLDQLLSSIFILQFKIGCFIARRNTLMIHYGGNGSKVDPSSRMFGGNLSVHWSGTGNIFATQ